MDRIAMRVYLPLTWATLGGVAAAGRLDPPRLGFAVTPALREWYASGDSEELEYVALTDAAGESLRVLSVEPGAPGRRVVLAVDVADAEVELAPGHHPAAVTVIGSIPRSGFASVHVDDPRVADEVASAAALVRAADAGDPDARFVVDGIQDHELQWYAIEEIEALLRN
jgi:hypothetical protein